MITPSNVARHELIGLRAKVVQARNPANIGIAGKIVDESYKTITLETQKGEKRVFKDAVTIEVELPDRKKVEIAGSLLTARPWDRIKKKLPKW
ncbi:MAG: ribonuclease P protein component 1 [Candidatus Nanoarchaeia archaeon]